MSKKQITVCDKCGNPCNEGRFAHFPADTPPLAKSGEDVCFDCLSKITSNTMMRAHQDPSEPYLTTVDGQRAIIHPSGCRCQECDAR